MPRLSEMFMTYRDGYQAFKAGKSPSDAPKGDARRMWLRGFVAARTDRERTNRKIAEQESTDEKGT